MCSYEVKTEQLTSAPNYFHLAKRMQSKKNTTFLFYQVYFVTSYRTHIETGVNLSCWTPLLGTFTLAVDWPFPEPINHLSTLSPGFAREKLGSDMIGHDKDSTLEEDPAESVSPVLGRYPCKQLISLKV
jgi:hypothetical protein